jgi:hypothetical protein
MPKKKLNLESEFMIEQSAEGEDFYAKDFLELPNDMDEEDELDELM